MELLYLTEEQNSSFDDEYHSQEELNAKIAIIRKTFPDGKISFLDVGGGNGKFMDEMLQAFSQAEGTIIDISEGLLALNKPHERKTLIRGSISDAEKLLAGRKFDVISLNWVLHHLVAPTYSACTDNCREVLSLCSRLLSERGLIQVAENMVDGIADSNIPSHLIYTITRISHPWFVSISKKYFNTAGVGVCFRSEKCWRSLFSSAKLSVVDSFYAGRWPASLKKRIMFLGLALVVPPRPGHFTLRPIR